MIQRIQTIWLLAASALGFTTLANSISFYSGNKLVDNMSRFVPLTARENVFILILTISVAVAALVSIFLYKDRKMQMKVVAAVAGFSAINLVLYFLQIKNYIEGKMDLTAIVAFGVPVFLLLAMNAIWKDEKLVKSVDRLR